MIAWVLIVGLLAVLLTAPAVAFGAVCGMIARVMVRDRKPPLPPPI